MARSFLLLGVLTLFGSGTYAAERPENILLVLGDDVDVDWLPWSAPINTHTPTLKRLAGIGTRFDNVWGSNRCAPSLASILTGRRPHEHGQTTNDASFVDLSTSFGHRLSARGYRSMVAGKWWWDDPIHHGFQDRFDWQQPWSQLARPEQGPVFAFLADVAASGQPFFLWWAPKLPHEPHDAGSGFLSLFPPESIPIPDFVPQQGRANWRHRQRQYLASQARFDFELRRLGREIRRLGLDENLRVIFCVDNGWTVELPSKGSWFERGIRCPVVVAGKAWPKGGVDERLLLLEDLHTLITQETLPERSTLARIVYAGSTLGDLASDAMAVVSRDSPGRKLAWFPNDVLAADSARWRVSHGPYSPFPERMAGRLDLHDLLDDPLEQSPIPGSPDDPLYSLIAELWQQATGG